MISYRPNRKDVRGDLKNDDVAGIIAQRQRDHGPRRELALAREFKSSGFPARKTSRRERSDEFSAGHEASLSACSLVRQSAPEARS